MISRKWLIVATFFTFLFTGTLQAQIADSCKISKEDIKKWFNTDSGLVAAKGYDPVAFFPEYGGMAIEGDSDISAEHCHLVYYFSTLENRDTFLQNPDRFEPGFGGWNPFSLSVEVFTDINPNHFDTSTGRLFFFINKETKNRFFKQLERPEKAHTFWDSILGSLIEGPLES